MRFLFVLTLAVAVTAEASARTDTLPPEFVGIWGRELERGAQCTAAQFESGATTGLQEIDLRGLSRPGAQCKFRRITRDARDPSIVSVRLWCRGRRQFWQANYTWRVVDIDGQMLLVVIGTPSEKRINIYRRCH